MNINDLIGYFTYRSFLNNPDGSPNDILFGQGELLLFISDEGIISGTLSFPYEQLSIRKEFMDLQGTIYSWKPLSLHFTGKGRKNSSIEDFEYEYDCSVNHPWDTSSPVQTLSLVGTVRRNKDHGQSKAGLTASFIATQRNFVEPREIQGISLIPETLSMLAGRKHRLIHNVWHTVRGMWNSLTDQDKEELRKFDWFLTDPPRNKDGTLNLSNGAGEDFLYMHRRMIKMVNDIYDKKGVDRPKSWKTLPSPFTPQFYYKEVASPNDPFKITYELDLENSGQMIPPATTSFMEQMTDPENPSPAAEAFLYFNKTPRAYNNLMATLTRNLRDTRVVSQLSLAAYGNLIEFTVHNWMHMRWAGISVNPDTGKPEVRNAFDISKHWDIPTYDYLGDFHSSHANPIFWKLHGWVDDCIEFWFNTQETVRAGKIKRKVVRGIDWFEKGDWVVKDNPFDWPGAEHHDHGHHPDNEIENLEKVMRILKEINDRDKVFITAVGERNIPSFVLFNFDIP